MKLLILGGTVFLGRHIVEAARSSGHEVTLFNRGRHNPDLFPDLETLRGDRDGGLDVLRGRRWDAAVDLSGYVPRLVATAAAALSGSVNRYVFISTISVYRDANKPGIDETAPLATLADPTTEEVNGETYGALKALCERAAEGAMPGRVLIVRPGLIVGPHDPSDRFTYWPHRVGQGGEVLAPAPPEQLVQFIDARDLAAWIVRMVERRATGLYNAVGTPLPFDRVLATCITVCGVEARPIWVGERFLLDQGVAPWMGLPLWIPQADESLRGLSAISGRAAVEAGLTLRPLEETVRDTLAWDATRAAGTELKAGLSRAREAALLRAWREAAGPHAS